MLIIFDWDGTLCDSTGRIVEAMRQAAGSLALPVPQAAAVTDIIGLALPEAMAILFPQQAASVREQMREAYSECYVSLDTVPSGLFSGALRTLDSLRARGHCLAVATGKSRRGLDRVLQGHGLRDFFDATRCSDETRSKPHPLMLEEILSETGHQPAQSLMVGDSEYDLAMARSAGVAGIGVSFGVHSPPRLQNHAPLAIIDELDELLELVALQ